MMKKAWAVWKDGNKDGTLATTLFGLRIVNLRGGVSFLWAGRIGSFSVHATTPRSAGSMRHLWYGTSC